MRSRSYPAFPSWLSGDLPFSGVGRVSGSSSGLRRGRKEEEGLGNDPRASLSLSLTFSGSFVSKPNCCSRSATSFSSSFGWEDMAWRVPRVPRVRVRGPQDNLWLSIRMADPRRRARCRARCRAMGGCGRRCPTGKIAEMFSRRKKRENMNFS